MGNKVVLACLVVGAAVQGVVGSWDAPNQENRRILPRQSGGYSYGYSYPAGASYYSAPGANPASAAVSYSSAYAYPSSAGGNSVVVPGSGASASSYVDYGSASGGASNYPSMTGASRSSIPSPTGRAGGSRGPNGGNNGPRPTGGNGGQGPAGGNNGQGQNNGNGPAASSSAAPSPPNGNSASSMSMLGASSVVLFAVLTGVIAIAL